MVKKSFRLFGTEFGWKTFPLFLCLLSVRIFLYFHYVTALEDHKKTGRQISLHKNIEGNRKWLFMQEIAKCADLGSAEKSKKNVTHKSYQSILKPCYSLLCLHASRSLLRNCQDVQREMVAVRPGYRVVEDADSKASKHSYGLHQTEIFILSTFRRCSSTTFLHL